jgi:DUF4097 and DUF4098 domain-containing protein YvlB
MMRARIILALLTLATFTLAFTQSDKGKGKVQAAGLVGGPASAIAPVLPRPNVKVQVAPAVDLNTETDVEVHPDVEIGEINVDVDDDSGSDFPLREEETINKTLTMGAGSKTLDVDNVNGSVEVVGTQGNQVQLVVKKTIRAESKAMMEAAKKEVTLDITDQPDLLKFYVNGPFRCNCNGNGDGCSAWRHGDRGYSVSMDFQLQVPRDIDVKVKTVNGGHVNVRNVSGKFSVNNVNGRIEMQDIAGSGHARTVNGAVKVSFRENPKENSDFSTINGDVDLQFAKGLSADFRFKTFNGEVFSDFEMTSLPARNARAEQHNGKFVFRTDRSTGGRVGSGGPEIKAENLNGSIRVLERHE